MRRFRARSGEIPRAGRWVAVLAAALLLSGGLTLAGLPAAVLIGCMLAALWLGRGLNLPAPLFVLAQAMIGAMIGSAMTLDLVQAFLGHWMLVLTVSAVTLLLSLVIGAIVGRTAGLDRMTSLWSSIPGLASGVVVMSATFGASAGVVAVGQYIRVVLVAILAASVSAVLSDAGAPAALPPAAQGGYAGVAAFFAVAAICAMLSRRIAIPGLNMILPMVATAVLQLSGLVTVTPWTPALLPAFAIVGLRVGVAFDAAQLRLALRALPHFTLGALALMAGCGIVSLGIGHIAGVDPVTAFLATIPGGLDSVAIVAATSGADLPFVMLFQTARFLFAFFIGVPLVRHISRSMASPLPGEDRA